MKKYFFLISVAALAMTACTNESEEYVGSQESKEIAFSPINNVGTRAISNTKHGFIDGTTFATTWDMTVAAVDITNDREFFEATPFHYQYANSASNSAINASYWGGETARYWPLSAAQINFLAIAHANSDNAATWTNTKADNKVVVEFGDNYAYDTKQYDFVYAIGNGEVTKSVNALSFPEKVDMTFKHTQAYLIFRVKANSAVEAEGGAGEITITNIKVKGARTKGKATIARHNPGTYADGNVDLTWEAPTSGTAYPTGGDADTYYSVTEDQNDIAYKLSTSFEEKGHLLVIPNMSSANTFAEGGFTSFEISYTLDGNDYTYEYTPATTKIEAGKKYTYDITFKLHEIFVNPTVTDWENAGTTPVEIPTASIAWNAVSPSFNVGSAAGTYYVNITGLTAGKAVSVAETTDANNIISSVSVSPTTVPASGVVTIAITVPISTGSNSATITLTNTTDSQSKVITINQPAL